MDLQPIDPSLNYFPGMLLTHGQQNMNCWGEVAGEGNAPTPVHWRQREETLYCHCLCLRRKETRLPLLKQCHRVSLFKPPTGHTSAPVIPDGIQLKSLPFPILLRQFQFELSVTSDSFKAKPQKHYLSHSINCSAFFGLLQDVIDPSGSFPQHSQRDKHTHAHAHMRQTHTRTRTCTHAHTHTKNKIREK